jgi:stage IV sporulation protein A
MCRELSQKYETSVIPINCLELTEEDIKGIIREVLYSFPIKEINFSTARWITSLEKGHWLRDDVFNAVRRSAESVSTMKDASKVAERLSQCEELSNAYVSNVDLGKGSVTITALLDSELFYKVLGETTGIHIQSEADLLPLLTELNQIKKEYDRIKSAFEEVETTGYGIVMPTMEELSLEEPEIIKQGGKYGVRLRASAPSIHLMKANITTTVSPIVGTEKQSEELVMCMLKEFEEDPVKIWESNIFGKSLHELVNEGLHNKLYKMPLEARLKIQETLERVINEGCGGLICFIL